MFALGAVATYATTGTGPFGDGDAAGLLYRIAHTTPDLTAVPTELRPLIARCLARADAERPTPAEVLTQIGPFDPVEWAPKPTPDAPPAPRPPTRPYTVAATPAAPAPPTEGEPNTGRGRAVFRTSRRSAVLMCVATTLAALVALSFADGASKGGNGGASLLFLIGFVLLAVPAVRFGIIAIRPRRWLEVSAEGLTTGAGTRVHILPWPEVARVRVIEDGRRPWLVVWVRGPDHHDIGTPAHGGRRIFPVGHERLKAARKREIRELRAALGWYAAAVHDPTP